LRYRKLEVPIIMIDYQNEFEKFFNII